MIALSYMLDTARVNGKTVWCLKNDSGISSWNWNLGKALGKAFHVTMKKFEWLGIQSALENKDVSWDSSLSRWASTKSTEKIHMNWTKENMSITQGQLQLKDRKRPCPKINWIVPIMWYQYLLGTFNASLPWLLPTKFYFIFHIHWA